MRTRRAGFAMGHMTDGAEPIVLAGAGAMGRALGVLLASAGTPTTLFTRPATAEQLTVRRHVSLSGTVGATVGTCAGPGAPGRLGVVADGADMPDGCGIVFTTKGPQLHDCAATVRAGQDRAGRAASWVAGVQNGVVKDDVLAAVFGAARTVRMASTLNARIDGPAGCVLSSWGDTYVGATGPPAAAEGLAEALGRAGVPASWVAAEQIDEVVWAKCLNAVGVLTVTALTRLPTDEAFRHHELCLAYLSVLTEAAAIASAYGVRAVDVAGLPVRSRLAGDADAVARSMVASVGGRSSTSTSYSSMAQDIIAGRPTEVEPIFGDLVRRAHRVGVPVPLLTLAYRLIRAQGPVGTSDSRPSTTTAAVLNEHAVEDS